MEIGRNFIVGLPSPDLDLATRTYLRAIRPSGVILFARNIRSPREAAALNAGIRELLGQDALICLDHEGGRVNRIKEFLGVIPSAQQLGLVGDLALARRHGVLAGKVMRLLGFNWDLCPVVDLGLRREVDNSVSDRTWSADPVEVVSLAAAFSEGLLQESVFPCAKHFPGYGSANKDPHNALPLVDRSLKQLLEIDLRPYRDLAARRLAPTVMIGHGHFPCFHRTPVPGSVSRKVVDGLLRRRMKYDGVVVTDDLEMGAITKVMSVEESAVKTLQAGADLVLICHTPEIMLRAFEAAEKAVKDRKISPALLAASARRIDRLRKKVPPARKYSEQAFGKICRETAAFTREVLDALPEALRRLDLRLGAVGEAYRH